MDQKQQDYDYSGRPAPQANEAEVFFLGGVMQDPNVLSDVVSLLDPEDFFPGPSQGYLGSSAKARSVQYADRRGHTQQCA